MYARLLCQSLMHVHWHVKHYVFFVTILTLVLEVMEIMNRRKTEKTVGIKDMHRAKCIRIVA